jgi:pyrroloquinoline quinone biosynthesis protein D
MSNPRLAAGVRLGFDHARGGTVLLAPESVTTLNDSGAAIVRLCDGTRSVAEITAALGEEYEGVQTSDIEAFIARLRALRCLKADW